MDKLSELKTLLAQAQALVDELRTNFDVTRSVRLNELNMRDTPDWQLNSEIYAGVMRAWAWGPVSSHPSDAERVYLKDIAGAVKHLVGTTMHSRKLGYALRERLLLPTLRATSGDNLEYKGTYCILWDENAMRELCDLFEVEYLERGSVKRPA